MTKNNSRYPFRIAVPYWGQTTQISSILSRKRDCGSNGVKSSVTRKKMYLLRSQFCDFRTSICDARAKFSCSWLLDFSFFCRSFSRFSIFWGLFSVVSLERKKKKLGPTRVGWWMDNVSKFIFQVRKIGRCMADLLNRRGLAWPARTWTKASRS